VGTFEQAQGARILPHKVNRPLVSRHESQSHVGDGKLLSRPQLEQVGKRVPVESDHCAAVLCWRSCASLPLRLQVKSQIDGCV